MKLIQWVNAYTAVQSMMDREMDYQSAHALLVLKGRLQPHAVFFVREERKLVEEFAARDDKGEIIWSGPGRFVFREQERSGEYERRRNELGAVQVQEEYPPLRMPTPKSIKPIHLEALEGFVLFGEEAEHGGTA